MDADVEVEGTWVRDIALEGAVFAGESGYRVVLARFRSVQFDPPLAVTNLSGIAVLQGGNLQLNDVVLHTRDSGVLLRGSVRQLDDPVLDLVVEADSLSLADIRGTVGMPARAIKMRGEVKGGLQSLVTEWVVESETSKVTFAGVVGMAPFALRGDAVFEIETDDLALWGIPLEYTLGFDLAGKGSVRVDSSGVEEARAEGGFRRVQIGDARFDSVRFVGNLADGLLRARVAAGGPSGNLAGRADARWADWGGDWAIRFRDLHVGQLPGVPETVGRATGRIDLKRADVWRGVVSLDKLQTPRGDVRDATIEARYADRRLSVARFEAYLPHWGTRVSGNGHVDAEGTKPAVAGHFQAEVALPQLMRTDAWGTALTLAGDVAGNAGGALTVALEGDIAGNPAVDHFRMSALLDSLRVSEIRADLSGAGGVFSARGQGHFDRHLAGEWRLDVHQLATVSEMVGVDLSGALALSGDFSGPWAAPGFSARGRADSLTVAGVLVQHVDLETRWARPDSGAVTLRINRLVSDERQLRAVFLDAVHARGETSFFLGSDARGQERVFFYGRAQPAEDHLQVAVDSLYIRVDQVVLHNEGPIRFAYSPYRGVQIGHLVLSGPAGRLVARNQPGFQATVEVLLNNLDMRPWAFVAGLSGAGGILNGEMVFAGTLADPLVFGTFALANGKVSGVKFGEATGEVSFGNDRMRFEAQVAPNKDEVLELSGSLPFADTGDIHLRARSEGIALRTRLNAGDEKTKLAGIKRLEGLELNTVLNAFFDATEGISGVLSLDLDARGRFDQPDIRGVIEMRDGALRLLDLNRSYAPVSGRAVVGDGKIQIDSLAVGPSANLSGDVTLAGFWPSRWNLSARFREFEPVAWPELQFATDGSLHFSGTLQHPKIEGELRMKQAEIRLAQLLETPPRETSDFLKALDLHLQLSAERQVWVRDPTFDVEIAGDVDVIKDRDGLRVYGTMTSRRGNYILQNRRLRITQGEIRFQGRPGGNPDLDIRAETRVRAVITEGAEAEPVDVVVTVGGTLTHPQVLVASGDQEDIGRIAALLLTGRSVEQFEFSREGTLDMVLGVAANRLGQRIGQTLSLDLVEVDVGEGNISRVRLGKYIGERLFMSYAQDISSTAHEVTMEFEVLPGVTFEGSQVVDENTKNRRTRKSIGLFWAKEW